MSSAPEAPESDEESRQQKDDAPDPRKVPAEAVADIDVSRCQAENRHGRQCGRDSIPGAFYCPLHLPDHADDAEVLERDGTVHAEEDDLHDRIDGVIVATTDSTSLRFQLEAVDDAILHPVNADSDPVTLTYRELARRYKTGEVYLPSPTEGRFGPTVDALADDHVVVTDGGLDQTDANTAASLLDDAAVALRDGDLGDALEYIDDALTTVENGGETA